MTKDTIENNQEQTHSRVALLREFGSAWRRRRSQAKPSWRETVTLFKPEPWVVALDHGKSRSPVKLRDLPEPSK
jgi:hypothetical protein